MLSIFILFQLWKFVVAFGVVYISITHGITGFESFIVGTAVGLVAFDAIDNLRKIKKWVEKDEL